MRVRYPFAGAFLLLTILSAYIGLLPHSTNTTIPPNLQPNDKLLHLLTFFLLSLIFYWIFETTRRRALHLTLLVCTLVLGLGSEILQGLLPNERPFDALDFLANMVGSLGAVGLNGWYHRRMLERRRKARYGALGDDGDGDGGEDVELGEHQEHRQHGDEETGDAGLGPQETGVMSLEQEVDNWDENAVDNWDTEDGVEEPGSDDKKAAHFGGTPINGEGIGGKKRSD